MIWKSCLFAMLLFRISCVPAYADLTAADAASGISKNLTHPYLYFTAEEKTILLERAETDPVCRDYFRRLLAESNRLLYTPVEAEPPQKSRNPRFDASYEVEGYLLANTRRAYDLALAYQMTGDIRFAEKAFEFADVVCDQSTWVHGAHEFPVIYDRVWPWGAKDDQAVFSYAQWSDHLVVQLAAVYDWLYPALDKRQRDRIRGALLEKAILRVRGNYEYHWWASAYRCNWCTVCNGSLGIAAAALLTEDPQLADVIAESYNRISRTLDEVGDGGWEEGIGYLRYMLEEALRFGDVLKRISNGKFNLYRHPRVESAISTLLHCSIPPDKTVHFGDWSGGKAGSYWLFNRLMLETGNGQAAWLRKYVSDTPANLLDCVAPRSDLAAALPAVASRHLRATDWVILRSDFYDPNKVTIAAKCGRNNDPHHGHLDQGHFSLYWKGREFLCDHGSAGYDKAYFDKERWTYPLANSMGHNVVMVNGEQQAAGKLKDEPWDESIGGRVVEFRPGKERDYTLLDPSGAYPGKELNQWRRHIIYEKPHTVIILDEVSCAPDAEIESRFHSAATQAVRSGYVSLKASEGEMALIPVGEIAFEIREGKHAVMPAQKNAALRWVPWFGVATKASGERTIMAAIILPADGAEAERIAGSARLEPEASGGYALSFTAGITKREYRFARKGDGLGLE